MEFTLYDAGGRAVAYCDDGRHLYAFHGAALAYVDDDSIAGDDDPGSGDLERLHRDELAHALWDRHRSGHQPSAHAYLQENSEPSNVVQASFCYTR